MTTQNPSIADWEKHSKRCVANVNSEGKRSLANLPIRYDRATTKTVGRLFFRDNPVLLRYT